MFWEILVMRRLLLATCLVAAPVLAEAQSIIGPAPHQGYQQIFTSSGTGVLPAWCASANLVLMGGGQSGAPGGTISAGQSGSGGGGGGSGAKLLFEKIPLSVFPTLNYSVQVGAGSASPLAGQAANSGGATSITFGSLVYSVISASGQLPTAGSQGSASTGGVGGNGITSSPSAAETQNTYWAASGGFGSSSTGVATSPGNAFKVPQGGAAGGGLNAGVFQPGAPTGYVWVTNSGQRQVGGSTDGAPGGITAPPTSDPLLSLAGAGGAGNDAGVGGAGSAEWNGSGGGGGGSGTGGGGAGGAGGNGYAIVECN